MIFFFVRVPPTGLSAGRQLSRRADSRVRFKKKRTPTEVRFNLAGELRLRRKNRPLAMISNCPCDARTRQSDTDWVPTTADTYTYYNYRPCARHTKRHHTTTGYTASPEHDCKENLVVRPGNVTFFFYLICNYTSHNMINRYSYNCVYAGIAIIIQSILQSVFLHTSYVICEVWARVLRFKN